MKEVRYDLEFKCFLPVPLLSLLQLLDFLFHKQGRIYALWRGSPGYPSTSLMKYNILYFFLCFIVWDTP
ncbi:hypothetical protein HanIR_Chr16g0806971 [Helianthus annuus]|nr:hypothetical protein HanIR_Chr16g0806971 [Helianthus annuus]